MVASKPPGDIISSGGPEPITSKQVSMPSIMALGINIVRVVRVERRLLTSYVPSGANIRRVRRDGLKRHARHIRVAIGLIVERRRAVAYRVGDRAHAAIQPRPTAKAADHRNRDGVRDRRTHDRPRVAEVEKRRTRRLKR